MPNEHVRNLFNAPHERREVVAGVAQSATRRGRIAVVSACYTIWMIACCTGPSITVLRAGDNASPEAWFSLPAWTVPLLCMAVVSTIIAAWFKHTRKVPDSSSWQVMLASIMTLAAVIHLVWALDRTLPYGADMVLYLVTSILTGVGAALFRVEIDRVFGWIGTQQTLYQGMIGTVLAAVVLVLCFAMGKSQVQPVGPIVLYGIAIVLPFVIIVLLKCVVRGFPRVRYYGHGREVALPFPTKFVTTSAVQGIAAGVLYMSLSVLVATPAFGSVDIVVGQVAAALLLFATLVFLRLDFNRFIYKVAFSFVAIGFLLLAIVPHEPRIGIIVLAAGFCYLDLVLWSLGACLMKNMGLPATWVASCPGAALFFGAVIGGAVTNGFLSGQSLPDAAMLASFVACFLFAAALLLSSGSNLKYGWGTVLPGEGSFEGESLANTVRFVATEHDITQRESEVMLLLAEGKTRRAICEKLTVSPDTVKTHVRAVYRKLGIHSQQELIDRLTAEREQLAEDDNRVLE